MSEYTVFAVPNRPEPENWFEAYAAIGRFGMIVDCREHKSNVLFTLKNTHKTHELKSMKELDCGDINISIGQLSDGKTYQRCVSRAARTSRIVQPPTGDVVPLSALESLNDDCLRVILRDRCLDADDLCSIARCSSRLNEAAKQAFESRYRESLHLRRKQFRRNAALLRLFGEHITTINIGLTNDTTRAYADIMLGLIACHCPYIERLMHCDSLMPISAAISRFDRRRSRGIVEAMPFGHLKSLKIRNFFGKSSGAIPPMRLPSLIELDMDMDYVSATEKTRQFFASHPHIKRLTLNLGHSSFPVGKILLPSSDLEELRLVGNPGMRDGSFHCFGRLKRLKTLACEYMSERNVRLIVDTMGRRRVQLERLEIVGHMQPTIVAIANKIRSLKYISCDIWQDSLEPELCVAPSLASMAISQENLQEIRVRLSDEVEFDYIRDFLTNAPDQLTAASFNVDIYSLDKDTWFSAENRETMAIIDSLAKSRGVELLVELGHREDKERVTEENVRQFGDWLKC